jgi:hypothetical protein
VAPQTSQLPRKKTLTNQPPTPPPANQQHTHSNHLAFRFFMPFFSPFPAANNNILKIPEKLNGLSIFIFQLKITIFQKKGNENFGLHYNFNTPERILFIFENWGRQSKAPDYTEIWWRFFGDEKDGRCRRFIQI